MPRPDRAHFAALVHAHHAAVFRAAMRILCDAAAAEDVTQQVFLRVLEGRSAVDGADEPGAVLRWLAARLALNALRAERARSGAETRAAAAMNDATADPHAAAVRGELDHHLGRALDALPDDLRLPLVLRFQEGLSFAAVGEALAIAESTAHERVQRGLERLRRLLPAAAASGGAAFDLGERLAGCQVPSPSGSLVPTLLALRVAPVTAGVAVKGALVAVAAAAIGATAWMASSSGEASGSGAGRAVAAAREAVVDVGTAIDLDATARAGDPGRTAAVAPPPPVADPDQAATLTGHVVDALAQPVAGATVHARSADSLKAPTYTCESPTDAAGGFRLEFPSRKHGYLLSVRLGSAQVLDGHRIDVAAGEELPPVVLRLPPEVGRVDMPYRLRVHVLGADGAPRSQVPVWVRAADAAIAAPWEEKVLTDEAGVAVVQSPRLGRKLVQVDPRQVSGECLQRSELDLFGGIERSLELRLLPGRRLEGVAELPDGIDLDTTHLWLRDDDTAAWHQTAIAADGSFAFTALDDGAYTLHGSGHRLSSFERLDVHADDGPLRLRFKLADDERAHGDHLGEVHGVLRDVATGEDLEVHPFDVERAPILGGESTLPWDVLDMRPLMAQRAAGVQPDPLPRRFHEVGLRAGRYALIVRKRGWAPRAWEVESDGHAVLADAVVELHPAATVRGRVLAPDGDPAAGTTVVVFGIGATADERIEQWLQHVRATERQLPPSMPAASARTDAAGRFTLSPPVGTRLRVVALRAGCRPSPSAELVLAGGEQRALGDLRLVEGN